MLNASLFGVPQTKRKSLFCLRKDFSSEYTLKYVKPEESYEMIFLNDILEQDVDKNVYINRDDVILDKIPVEKQLKPIRIGQVNKGIQGERIYSPFGHSLYQLVVAVSVLEPVFII
nr:DNA methyltransferase [Rickettsia honei]